MIVKSRAMKDEDGPPVGCITITMECIQEDGRPKMWGTYVQLGPDFDNRVKSVIETLRRDFEIGPTDEMPLILSVGDPSLNYIQDDPQPGQPKVHREPDDAMTEAETRAYVEPPPVRIDVGMTVTPVRVPSASGKLYAHAPPPQMGDKLKVMGLAKSEEDGDDLVHVKDGRGIEAWWKSADFRPA